VTATVERWSGAGRIHGPGAMVFYVVLGGFIVEGDGGGAQQIQPGSAAVVRALGRPFAFESTVARSLALSAVVRAAPTASSAS
jgi:hypothetical protein